MNSRLIVAFVIAAGFGVATAHPVSAAMMSGTSLVKQCEASPEICGGYILGVIDQWGGFDVPANIEKLSTCVPAGVTIAVLAKITTDYLTAHPELVETGANTIVVAALEDAMVC